MDSLTQFAIENGKIAATIASDCKIPTNTLKMCLEFVEEHSISSFLAEVEKGLQIIDIESLDKYKALKRLYRIKQVIAKAITNDKILRFKNLAINGIVCKNAISDNEYETFVEITDQLNDDEFLYLSQVVKNIPKNSYKEYKEFREMYQSIIPKLKSLYGFSDDKILYLRNSLIGKGLLNWVMTYGGLELGHIVEISYKYVQFVETFFGEDNAK